MYHPDVELRLVNPTIGRGLFATRAIPMGTVTWVMCEFERTLDHAGYARLSVQGKRYIDRYAYSTSSGQRILCCDVGRYINHSCDPNTITLPDEELEVAVRDIEVGEELTDDYATFDSAEGFACCCGSATCRGVVDANDRLRLAPRWLEATDRAARRAPFVEQPLSVYAPPHLLARLTRGQRAVGASVDPK